MVYGCKFPETAIDYAKERGIRVVDYYKEDGVAERNALTTAEGRFGGAYPWLCEYSGERVPSHWIWNVWSGTGGKTQPMEGIRYHYGAEGEKESAGKSYGYRACSFDAPKDTMSKYDFIFNTVPAPVLTKERLQGVKPEVCIIDIASRPGGTDFFLLSGIVDFAKLCLGLPAFMHRSHQPAYLWK